MPNSKPNNKNYSLPERYFSLFQPRKKRPSGWKIGLGVGAAILLVTVVLFSSQIGNLLSLWGIKAQKSEGPKVTLSLTPTPQGAGPSDTVQYEVIIQVERGTYLNPLDPSDPKNGSELPFIGSMNFNVSNIVSQYSEFIQSATITVPIENPNSNYNRENIPMITVLDGDIERFLSGLGFWNRRLTPPDMGFITTPPILTIVLKPYALNRGGFPINFQVGATFNYAPAMGIMSTGPAPGQNVTVEYGGPADGVLNLEGGVPDFSLVITPKSQSVDSGEIAEYDVAVGSLNNFAGDITLTAPGLDGFITHGIDSFTLLPGMLTLAVGETKHSTLTIQTTVGLTDVINLPIIIHGYSAIWISVINPDTGGTVLQLLEITHDDNATLRIDPIPDYSLSIDPLSITVSPTGSAIYNITIHRIGGFAGPVNLSVDDLTSKPGVGSANFAQNEVDQNQYSLIVTANGTVFNADYPFYVKGATPDLGGLPAERWAPNKLAIPTPEPPAHFIIQSTAGYTLEVKPDSQSVYAGLTADYTVKVTLPVNGFNEPVLLNDDILLKFSDFVEAGGVTYDQNPITLASGTTLHIKTKSGVTNPGFEFTVYGDSIPNHTLGSDKAILAIGVAPDFSLSIIPLTQTVAPNPPGNSAVYEVRILRVGGFADPVTLSCDDLTSKPGVGSVIFTQNEVDPNQYSLIVTANGTVFNADYPFYVKGNNPVLGDRWAPNKLATPLPEPPAHFIIQSAEGFSIAIEPPTSKTVNPGGTAIYHILLTRLNGYAGTVHLTHNLASQFVVPPTPFDDPDLENGQNDTYLRVTATNPADDSTLPFEVQGSGTVQGVPTESRDNGTFIIQNLGNYQIAIDPDSRTVAPGGITTYTITLTREFGFISPVNLSTDLGSKAGVQSAVFNPVTLSGLVLTSTLTVTINNPASDATHLFTVYGDTPNLNGSPAQRTDTATLIIRNTPDFNIQVMPPSITIAPGGTAVYDVTLQIINNYAGTVSLSDNLLSAYGAYIQSATFDVTTLSAADTDTKLHVTAKPGIGNQDIIGFTVTGTGLVEGILTNRTDTADLLIRNPYDYHIAIDPNSRTVAPGGVTTYTITLTRDFGFIGPVTLTTNLGSMAGVQSAVIIPGTLTPLTGDSATLTVTAADPASDATYLFTVNGDTPDLNGTAGRRTAQATFIIENNEDFTIAITPKTKQVAPGGATSYIITVTRINNFTGTINLTTDLSGKAGIQSAQFADSALDSTETATTLNVITLGSIPTTDIPFLVFGQGYPEGLSTTKQDSATLSVVDFQINIDPNSRTVVPGQSTTYIINLTRLNNFSGTVNLTTDLGSKPYIKSAVLADTALDSSETSTVLSVETNSPAPDSTTNFTVTGDSIVDATPLSHQAVASLTFFTPTVPDFTITVMPKTQTIDINTGNTSTTYDVTLHRINGFNQSVTLSTDLLANNPDYIAQLIFDIDVFPAGATDQTTVMHVTVKTIIGNIDLPFTVTGKETSTGSPERSDSALLSIIGQTPPPPPPGGGGGGGGGGIVTPPATGGNQDYTIKVDPVTATTIYPGQSATYQVTIIRTGGFTGAVALTTDVLKLNPDVVSATFAKNIIPSGENNTTLVLVARPGATIDSHTIFTVQGTSVDLGDRKDDDQVAIIIPGLPSTGPAPSPWFWAWVTLLTLISWQQLHLPRRVR